MRCLVIGCGSIGARRARLLDEMGHEVGVYDSDVGRAARVRPPGRPRGFPVVMVPLVHSYRIDRWDAAFVCTPAQTHLAVAREVIEAGCRALFIEKPLSTSMDGVAELVEECERRGVVTMGACNMRWAYGGHPTDRPHVERLSLETSGPLSGWRAGAAETYRANGIILESAIHDLDLASAWLGQVASLDAYGDGDWCRLDVTHRSGATSAILNDWREDAPRIRELGYFLRGSRFCHMPTLTDEMYRKEMAQFLRAASGKELPANPLRQAAETLRWALHARDLTRKVAA